MGVMLDSAGVVIVAAMLPIRSKVRWREGMSLPLEALFERIRPEQQQNFTILPFLSD